MPYEIKKNKDNSFKVINSDTGRVTAKKTTKSKAKRQMAYLYMLEDLKNNKKVLTKGSKR